LITLNEFLVTTKEFLKIDSFYFETFSKILQSDLTLFSFLLVLDLGSWFGNRQPNYYPNRPYYPQGGAGGYYPQGGSGYYPQGGSGYYPQGGSGYNPGGAAYPGGAGYPSNGVSFKK
jgi:hypothetical protein